MPDHFGVTEENRRDGALKDPRFAASEASAHIGRAAVAPAADPEIMAGSGGPYGTGGPAAEYGSAHVDGSRPDFMTYYRGVPSTGTRDASDITLKGLFMGYK
ncbi:hypothetical protein GCM10010517_08010 [Streptosporangium fragile]|uniref:Uncharacterized protein n=1 Tax=Streptosporangium fragile TaxID=46186 RepID=A0ABN3VTJ3_9ACTN